MGDVFKFCRRVDIMFQDENVRYFDEPEPQNTGALIEAVKGRIKRAGIEYVVVASESGNTALKAAEALRESKVKVVCVTAYGGLRLAWPESGKWPSITGEKGRGWKVWE
jgi:hypothetical protein